MPIESSSSFHSSVCSGSRSQQDNHAQVPNTALEFEEPPVSGTQKNLSLGVASGSTCLLGHVVLVGCDHFVHRQSRNKAVHQCAVFQPELQINCPIIKVYKSTVYNATWLGQRQNTGNVHYEFFYHPMAANPLFQSDSCQTSLHTGTTSIFCSRNLHPLLFSSRQCQTLVAHK